LVKIFDVKKGVINEAQVFIFNAADDTVLDRMPCSRRGAASG